MTHKTKIFAAARRHLPKDSAFGGPKTKSHFSTIFRIFRIFIFFSNSRFIFFSKNIFSRQKKSKKLCRKIFVPERKKKTLIRLLDAAILEQWAPPWRYASSLQMTTSSSIGGKAKWFTHRVTFLKTFLKLSFWRSSREIQWAPDLCGPVGRRRA